MIVVIKILLLLLIMIMLIIMMITTNCLFFVYLSNCRLFVIFILLNFQHRFFCLFVSYQTYFCYTLLQHISATTKHSFTLHECTLEHMLTLLYIIFLTILLYYYIIFLYYIITVYYYIILLYYYITIIFLYYYITILQSISEISSCFFGPRPWHIEIRHRVKKTSTIILLGFETLKLKIRRLKLWKPTVYIHIYYYITKITILLIFLTILLHYYIIFLYPKALPHAWFVLWGS